ncbi:cellulose synthase subunit BcsC-related outer membrane protein [Roseomonas sp. WA12]
MTTLRHHLLAAAATAACLASGSALAQGSVGVLVEQAGFWRAQGQPARAAAALERALTSQPSNPDALTVAALTQLELGQPAGAAALLDRLRTAVPGDVRVARVEEALRAATARTEPALTANARQAGQVALGAGDVARAAQAFEAVLLRDPNDVSALGVLGLARMRQGRAAEARDLLGRAAAGTSDEARRWDRPLDEAAFLVELTEARRQVALGAPETAETVLLRASRRDVADRAEAEAMLGELSLRAGELPEAENRFRNALIRRPALPTASYGLLESLRRQGRIAEADSLSRQLASDGASRADALRAEAARTEDPESALALLRKAALAAPDSTWMRLDLARLLSRQDRAAEGRALLETGMTGAAATQAAALFAEEEGRVVDAIRLLERLPDRLRGPEQARLLRSLRWQVEVGTALAQPLAERRAALLALAGRVDPTGEALLLALRGFLRAGDREGASEVVRLVLSAGRGVVHGARINLAAMLSDARMEREAADVLQPLMNEAALSPAQRRQVAALFGSAPQQVAAAPAPIEAEAPRLYQGARDPRVAGRIAEAVLRRDPRNVEARIGAIEAALMRRDLAAAETLLTEGRLLNGSDPRVSVMEARMARAGGDGRRAQIALQLAADQRRAQLGGSGGLSLAVAETPYRRTMLAGEGAMDGQGSSFSPLASNPASAAVGGVTPSQLRASEDPLLSEIGRQLAEVNEQASGRIVPNFAFRARSGDRGLERLREYGGGVEAAVPLPSIGGELSARLQAVTIDAGRLDSSAGSLNRFGTIATLPSGALDDPGRRAALRPRDESATGTSIGAAYTRGGVTVDIGSTPLGFREQTILGGVELTPRLSQDVQLRLRAERRSVTDSLLSWSGMRDPNLGLTFGGVVRNTGRGQIEYFAGRFGAYAGAGYSTLNGKNVADNTRIEAGGGVTYAVMREPDRELVGGLDLTYYGYDKNLRLFTLGHGGYFSPQTYVGLSIPVDYRQRWGDWALRVGGTAGVAYFREKRSDLYPTDRGLQDIAEQQAGATRVSAFYPSQSATSFIAGARADLEYAITPSLRVGASARYDRSADFNETRALVYARYRFDP